MADAMDSKSISRKGVGVQVPASAPRAADPLAKAMLPVLLHRMGNAAQLLNGLDALLAVDPSALEARAGDLAAARDQVDDLGWLLALLASASGAHLLLDRRERAGLAPLVDAVRACLRREQRDLDAGPRSLPGLAPDVGDGWQLPWGLASFLYLSGASLPARASLRWSLDIDGGAWRLESAAEHGAALDGVLQLLPGVKLRREGELTLLELPRTWLLA